MGVDVSARVSSKMEKLSETKVAAPLEAAQERFVASLMEVGVSPSEHDVSGVTTSCSG